MLVPDDKSSITETLSGISKLLSHRTRLGICVLLSRHSAISFSRFKELLEETDGNLGAQLRKLEDSGLITVRKEFLNRKPVSWYAITDRGRSILSTHLDAMLSLAEAEPPKRQHPDSGKDIQ
jgi:DNA-binding HxlR family transcriptional regulator